MVYAKDTGVSVERSRGEIERILERYGADAFSYATDQARAVVQFRMNQKVVRFEISLPDKTSEEFTLTPSKKWSRDQQAAHKEWEQACRQRWRSLALVVKAKLEAIEAGIASFEEEFLSFIVLPDGQRVGDWMLPQLEMAYLEGKMPPMLPPGTENND